MIGDLLRRGGRILLGVFGPTTITTSAVANATAPSGGRRADRTSNGVLWTTHHNDGWMRFWYSTDNGATWTDDPGTGFASSTTNTYVPSSSFFIDIDDYAHFVWRQPGAVDGRQAGCIYYMRGTPNASRTSWAWSTAVQLSTGGTDCPDVVAHREGTGWKAHVVHSFTNGSNESRVFLSTLTIASTGTITQDNLATSLREFSSVYNSSVHMWPSIDFHHSGDGKTVANGTPHLYVGWSSGGTGTGRGIRFKKATYSAGSWSAGTEREIDSTRYVKFDHNYLSCMFDGARVMVAGSVDDGTTNHHVLYERDIADTATTTRVLVSEMTDAQRLLYGSATFDYLGNVYLFGRNNVGSTGTFGVQYRRWVRETNTLEAAIIFESTGSGTPWVSAKRGYSDNRIELIYTDGTSTPYNVNFYGMDS